MRLSPGDILGGRYQIVALIGQGGQGFVYRARDMRVATEVAIKVLRPELASEPEHEARFIRELQALAVLSDTCAVAILDLDTREDTLRYVVTELMRGRDLEAFFKEREAAQDKLRIKELCDLLDPVVETLELAHGYGIVHRDLKPANVFVLDRAFRGRVRLLDFGFAKVLSADQLTATGLVAGSPSCIAPEAWAGRSRELDRRVDVYGLGVLAFRGLSGRVPFPSRNPVQVFRLATEGERPSLHALRPDLPRAVDDWTRRVLAVSPDDRYPTVRGAWDALRALDRETY
jgi:eukaryotic-like serine/threonine-protein kinase